MTKIVSAIVTIFLILNTPRLFLGIFELSRFVCDLLGIRLLHEMSEVDTLIRRNIPKHNLSTLREQEQPTMVQKN